MSKPIILVTGANGQLGRQFQNFSKGQTTHNFKFCTREDLDITDRESVLQYFDKFKPAICINCAAYTAVDNAEKDQDQAFRVNENGLKNLIYVCQPNKCLLINFSTDYVYHSIDDRPLKEIDPCQPQGIYAKSKRAGEIALEHSNLTWINFRVSWLYSIYNKNFVKTMIRLGQIKDEISIVSDQIGSPTYARDLVNDVMEIITQSPSKNLSGHYNYSNLGTTDWASFAEEIFNLSQIKCNVHRISTENFGAPAPRPPWSVLSKKKIINTFNLHLADWKMSLANCLVDLERK